MHLAKALLYLYICLTGSAEASYHQPELYTSSDFKSCQSKKQTNKLTKTTSQTTVGEVHSLFSAVGTRNESTYSGTDLVLVSQRPGSVVLNQKIQISGSPYNVMDCAALDQNRLVS